MKIETIIVGPLQVNCYILFDEETRQAMVVDPGDNGDDIQNALKEKNLVTEYIVCTHAHFDHIGAVSLLKEKTGAKIVLNRKDLEIYLNADKLATSWGFAFVPPPAPDMYVGEGDILSIGKNRFKVIETPGHSPGGICLLGEDIILTGDTVFAGSIGRTDFHGGSLAEMKKSFSRIISLPPELKILPGHGPQSTVKDEKESNFFVYEL